MNFPPQYREHALPSIIVPSADRLRGNGVHHDTPFGRSPAMSIPGMHQQSDVPPPLPPPRYLPGSEPRTQDGMRDKRDNGYGPGSFAPSGYGSIGSSFAEESPNYQRREKHADEGYASFSSTDRSRDSGPTEFGLLHNHYRLRSAADDDVNSMMKKLDPMRPLERSPPRSLLSASANELISRRPSAEGRFPPLSLPIHTRTILGSPARMDTPQHSTLSPRSTPFHYGDRSPKDGSDLDRSPRTRVKRNNSDDASSTQGSFDFSAAEDMEMEDAQSLKRLHIDDAYSAGGLKRRAASPPDEHMLMGQVDVARRREMGSRGSPTPRLSTIPQGSSLSSIPSTSRSNSYMSTISMPASSITTANSFGRRSPNGLSTGGISPTSCNSPYATPSSLNPSPRASISARGSVHSRTVSNASARKLNEVQKPGGTKLQSIHMCECCPKKPKRFDTAEELSAHEAEKQYECSFCGNRFKNKNEMERHQNSLHVRRHSWSCSALSGYDRAFHDSTNRPGEADSCGYCGEEFARSGLGPGTGALSGGSPPRIATDQDWDERIRHLQEVHKFRECNSSKKFYRADHFRQHLKHSHAGTSGKWTNMLENACMLEEDPTPR